MTDRLVALLLAAVVVTVAIVFLASPTTEYRPQACEADCHFSTAAILRCGALRLPHTTVGLLYPLVTAMANGLVEPAYYAGKLVNLVFAGLLVGLTYLTAFAATRTRPIALAVAVMVGANPTFFFYGTLACTDMMAAFFAVLALHWHIQSPRAKKSWWPPLATGIAVALATLVRDQYYFFAFGLFVAAFVRPYPRASARWWNAGGTVLAFAAVLAIYTVVVANQFQVSFIQVLDWPAVFKRRHEIAAGSSGIWPTMSVLGQAYRLSIAVLNKVVGLVPLLAAAAALMIPTGGARRLVGATWIPLAAYFVGIGWFTTPDTTEVVDRMYLVFLPMTMLVFALVLLDLARRLFADHQRWPSVAVAAVLLATTAGIGLIQIPRLSYFLPADPSPLHDVRVAQAFRLRRQLRCEIVIAPSQTMGFAFDRSAVVPTSGMEMTWTNDWLLSSILPWSEGMRRWPLLAVFPEDPAKNHLQVDRPFGPKNSFQLERMDSVFGFNLYRIRKIRPPVTQ